MGDTETRLASPWGILENKEEEKLMRAVREVIKNEGVIEVVVGVPFPLADQTRVTDQAKEIRGFIERLRQTGIIVHEENETLSTQAAKTQAEEMGVREKRDDLAATVILQSYLDGLPS